jgi:predicted outer membrane repeat protein
MSRRQPSRPNAFASACRRIFTGRKPAPRPAPRRLSLEHLEDRVVPAVINVNSLADVPLNQLAPGQVTLREAIQIANTDGDATNTINLTVPGTYRISLAGKAGEADNLAGELAIFTNANANQTGLNLTIQNTSGGNVAIDGNHLTRVLDINPNNVVPGNNALLGTVTINGVTIENGLAQPGDGADGSGGGIRDQGAVSLILNSDVVTNNSATADGGGIAMENAASTRWTLTLNNTVVSNNHAGDAGGGVEEDGTGTVNVSSSLIADNTCLNQGAGIWLDAINGGTANLNVNGSIIRGNSAGMLAGGIGQAGSSTVTITNSTIENNFATGFGGGFADENGLGTLVVENSLFLDNSAGTNGGGIFAGGPTTTITNSEIKGNAAGVNGAMPIGTTGHGAFNPVMGSGGGLFIGGGTLTLQDSTIADNTASVNGGGIELEMVNPSSITNTTIVGNTALNNAGNNNGGGIDDLGGPLALVNDTITGNYAANGGGLFFPNLTGLTIKNTIIARNAAIAGPDVGFVRTPTGLDLGGNLIGIGDPAIFTAATTQQGTFANPLDPLLAGLTNNGGPLVGAPGAQIALETEALLPGSPAIGKGIATGATTTDERGFGRINTVDVGAFQFQNVTLEVTVTPPPAGAVVGTPVTFLVTVVDAGGTALPPDGSTLTVTLPPGLVPLGPLTFAVGPLAPGQAQTFAVTAFAGVPGPLTVTATVTSPDANPNTVSNKATLNVIVPTPPPIVPPTTTTTTTSTVVTTEQLAFRTTPVGPFGLFGLLVQPLASDGQPVGTAVNVPFPFDFLFRILTVTRDAAGDVRIVLNFFFLNIDLQFNPAGQLASTAFTLA